MLYFSMIDESRTKQESKSRKNGESSHETPRTTTPARVNVSEPRNAQNDYTNSTWVRFLVMVREISIF